MLAKQLRDIQHELAKLREEAEQRKAARKKKRAARKDRKATEALGSQKSVIEGNRLARAQRGSSLQPVAQLEPGSYLERAFAGITGGDPSDSSSSSASLYRPA